MKRFTLLFLLFTLFFHCTDSTSPESTTYVLAVLSGDQQVGFQNTELDQPVVLRLTDDSGDPHANMELNLEITGGGGRIVDADSVTDANGHFEIQWRLGEDYVNTLGITLNEDPSQTLECTATARFLYEAPALTDDGWEPALLSSVGIETDPIIDMVDNIRTDFYQEVHSVVIIKNGQLVFEVYFPGHDFGYTSENFHGRYINFNRNSTHNTHSATKSIASALIGIAIDQGFIPDEDEPIFTYFQSHANLAVGGRENITIKHLLTMSSGLQWNEWDVAVGEDENDVHLFNNMGDPVHFFLSKPLLHTPGTTFYYNGGGVDILGEIVTRSTGSRVDVFADDHLFGPLGITNYQFQRLPNGMMCCHGDIYIRPRDLAKFGTLYLRNGIWEGEEIISQEWVRKSIQPLVPLADWHLGWADDYGYLWWMMDYFVNGSVYHSFKALGWGGQQITVFPELDMVVVFTGANYMQHPPCDDMLLRFILPAVE